MKDKKRVPAKAIISALQEVARATHQNMEGINACVRAIGELERRIKAMEGTSNDESGGAELHGVHAPEGGAHLPPMGTDGWSDEAGVAGSGGGSGGDVPSVVRGPVEEERAPYSHQDIDALGAIVDIDTNGEEMR